LNIYGSRFFISFLSLLILSGSGFALDSEYKNSLVGIDVKKGMGDNYDVVIYTQKNYTEPLKVIKKNDLNYYILLPETNNSKVKIVKNTQDVKSITTDSYSYAGQEDNNGYTKITINTTKPMNFSVNSTTNSFESALKKEKEIIAHQVVKVTQEKPKNVAQTVSLLDKKELDSKVEYIEKTIEPTKTRSNIATRIAKKNVNEANKRIQKRVQTKDLASKKIREKTNNKAIEEIIAEDEVLLNEEVMAAAKLPLYDVEELQSKTELDELPEIELLENIDASIATVQETFANKAVNAYSYAKAKLKILKNKLKNKLDDFGLSLSEFAMILSAFFGVIVLMALIFGRKNSDLKLTKRSDLIQKIDKKNKLTQEDIVVNKETKNNENNGQYFIFSDNVRQTGFCDPSTSALEKSYELSTYDPDLALKYNKLNDESLNDNKDGEEFEIINKILKEDNYIEIIPDEFSSSGTYQNVEASLKNQNSTMLKEEKQSDIKKVVNQNKKDESQLLNRNPYFTPIEKEKEQKTVQQVNEQEEIQKEAPKVISSVEIVPGRGFMCVKYDDSVHFMGYIFDDVYALYNFKKPYLENSKIQYRVSDKSEKFVDYMVRIENVKLVVSVSNAGMKLKTIM